MPRRLYAKELETRSARLRLQIRKTPYFLKLTRGLALGCRRLKTDGTWLVRVTKDGTDWVKAIGSADVVHLACHGFFPSSVLCFRPNGK